MPFWCYTWGGYYTAGLFRYWAQRNYSLSALPFSYALISHMPFKLSYSMQCNRNLPCSWRNTWRYNNSPIKMAVIATSLLRVFFLGGLGRPPDVKILPVPPTDRCPHFLTTASPPNRVLSPKISNILPNFSLNFDYFLAQNCTRKWYFMLKTLKFALILL